MVMMILSCVSEKLRLCCCCPKTKLSQQMALIESFVYIILNARYFPQPRILPSLHLSQVGQHDSTSPVCVRVVRTPFVFACLVASQYIPVDIS